MLEKGLMNMSNVKKWWFYLSIGVVLIIVYKTDFLHTMNLLLRILTPFVVGFVLAYFLIPLKVRLEKKLDRQGKKFAKEHKNTISAMVVYFGFLIILLVIVLFLVPFLKASVMDLSQRLPQYYQKAVNWLQEVTSTGWLSGLDLQKHLNNLSIGGFLQGLNYWQYLDSIMSITGLVFYVFTGFIVLAYVLLDHKKLRKTFDKTLYKIAGTKKADEILLYLQKVNRIFMSFFYGKTVASFILGAISVPLFLIAKVPYALLMGLILAVTNLIPYFGAVIGTAVIMLVSFLSKGYMTALWVLIISFALQQLDNMFLSPRVLKDTVGLSGFWILFTLVVGGGLFGFWGMVLGVPVAAALKMLYYDYMDLV